MTSHILTDSENEEMKALQDKRKATEGHLTDSERIRLSELMGKNVQAKTSVTKEEPEPPKSGFGSGKK